MQKCSVTFVVCPDSKLTYLRCTGTHKIEVPALAFSTSTHPEHTSSTSNNAAAAAAAAAAGTGAGPDGSSATSGTSGTLTCMRQVLVATVEPVISS
jgi:hypothetical protein